MNLINLLLLLSLAIAAIAYFSPIVTEKKHLLRFTAVLLTIVLLTYSSSANALAANDLAALGADDSTLTREQQQLEEDLKLTPDGGHYSGIEYAERTNGEKEAVSDETIEKSIQAYTSDNVVVAVANGSVRLSGRVKDKEVAQHIVEQIKAIPGVHEVTFNLGLDNKAS